MMKAPPVPVIPTRTPTTAPTRSCSSTLMLDPLGGNCRNVSGRRIVNGETRDRERIDGVCELYPNGKESNAQGSDAAGETVAWNAHKERLRPRRRAPGPGGFRVLFVDQRCEPLSTILARSDS